MKFAPIILAASTFSSTVDADSLNTGTNNAIQKIHTSLRHRGVAEVTSLPPADEPMSARGPPWPRYQKNWWELGMADDVLNEVGLYYLGQAWYQASDIGEVLETMSRCDPNDPWSWSREFLKTADRMQALGKKSAGDGHHISAGQSYLREATYRRAALHRHPNPYDSEVAIQAQLAVVAFEKFLAESNYPCKSVHIPYEDTFLPGYLCINPNAKGPAPTIIFNEGKDGWAEDGKFVVDESLPRGYNVLLYDGPGIGKAIRLQGLPFRHDWEHVITPIVDYLCDVDEVDETNLALISVSLGGYLGPRAAAYEHRLKALIANPGVVDWSLVYENFLNEIDPNLMSLLETDPETFDATIYQAMQYSGLLRWGMTDSMWHHNQTTPHGLMREVQKFTNADVTRNIRAPTMVIDAEMEERGQSRELYEALVNSPDRAYVKFTMDEAAQLHVQPGATAILTLRMFDWLDDVFAADGSSSAAETAESESHEESIAEVEIEGDDKSSAAVLRLVPPSVMAVMACIIASVTAMLV